MSRILIAKDKAAKLGGRYKDGKPVELTPDDNEPEPPKVDAILLEEIRKLTEAVNKTREVTVKVDSDTTGIESALKRIATIETAINSLTKSVVLIAEKLSTKDPVEAVAVRQNGEIVKWVLK